MKGYSSSTRNVMRSALRSFFDYCVEEGILSKNPVIGIKVGKIINNTPPPLSESELFALGEVTRVNIRDHVMIGLFLCSGLRVTEMSSILISEINWNREQIEVDKGKGLTARTVYFSYDCKQLLREYLDTRNDDSPNLFVTRLKGPFTRQGIHKLLKGYISEANLRSDITVHTLRHNFGRSCIEKGLTAQETSKLLGHKYLKSSQRYCKPSNKTVKKNYNKFR